MRSSPDLEIDLPRRDRHSPCPSRDPPPLQRRPQTHRSTLVLSQTNIQFEAFLPSDQRSVPYHMSSYTHTAPESPSFTSSLYSYFSLTPGTEDVGTWPGRFQFPAPLKAVYSFSLSPDDPWAQLALQGNLVKLSPHKPGLFKAIVPCFGRRDFVRLKKMKLNDLVQSGEGEMIWVNEEKREVGVWTRVVDRTVIDMEEEIGGGKREMTSSYGVPRYTRQREGSVKYTLGFDYLALKTGFVRQKVVV